MQRIAIIGGGPAGLTAAIEGAKNGLSVTLYEKYKIGENIRCAEGFFDTLNMLGKPKYGVRFKVQEIVLGLKSDYTFLCDDKINIWMVDRCEWQKGLADEARALGVNIVENAPITKELYKEIASQYEWVIDSTGVPSITSLVHGFNKYYTETSAITAQYTLQGDFSNIYGKIKIGIEDRYTGYYWIFPKSQNEAHVGIGYFMMSNFNIWSELDRVLEKEGISSYKRIRKLGGLCPVVKLDRLVYNNILLSGDAAGLVSPVHGGGIDTACISGKIAIQSILSNSVDNYENEINNILGQKQKGEEALRELWRTFHYDDLDYVIKTIQDADIKLGDCGFFNGKFHMIKKVGYIKFLLSPGKKNFYINLARKLLPVKVLNWVFTYLLTDNERSGLGL